MLPAPPLHTPQLVDRALELAAPSGDENPRTLKVVSGRHDAVVRELMGAGIGRDRRRVYGLVMTGHFNTDQINTGWPPARARRRCALRTRADIGCSFGP